MNERQSVNVWLRYMKRCEGFQGLKRRKFSVFLSLISWRFRSMKQWNKVEVMYKLQSCCYQEFLHSEASWKRHTLVVWIPGMFHEYLFNILKLPGVTCTIRVSLTNNFFLAISSFMLFLMPFTNCVCCYTRAVLVKFYDTVKAALKFNRISVEIIDGKRIHLSRLSGSWAYSCLHEKICWKSQNMKGLKINEFKIMSSNWWIFCYARLGIF